MFSAHLNMTVSSGEILMDSSWTQQIFVHLNALKNENKPAFDNT